MKRLWLNSLLLAVAALLVLVAAYVYPPARQWLDDADVLTLALRYRLRGTEQADPRIRVVGITEHTIQAFADAQVFYPFPRNVHALALRRLADAGASLAVVDILFSEAGSWDEAEDEQLAGAIRYAQSRGCQVVLAAGIEETQYARGVSSRSLLTPAPAIMQAAPALGLANTRPKLSYKRDESISFSLPLAGGQEQTFFTQPVQAFRLICERDGRNSASELSQAAAPTGGQYLINYLGAPQDLQGLLYHYESLFPGLFEGQPERVLSSAEAAGLASTYKGTVVFLGSRAQADNDYFNTPFGLMFGVDTNAQAFDTLFRRRILHETSSRMVLALLFLLAAAAWGCALIRPLLWSSVLGACFLLLIAAGNVALFILARIELPLSLTLAGFGLPFIACALYNGLSEEAAKRRIRSTFIRYLDAKIVERIISDPGLADLGGAEKHVAVLFTDIRGYSTITERLSPQQIVEMLNCHLGRMTEIIRAHGGFVDKYLGDGLMACFGGPVPTTDPAGDALRAALEMVLALEDHVRPELEKRGLPTFKAGIGIHLGTVVMGNIGSPVRMDYTVIGDAVNVASRVEGQTKEYRWALLATREAVEAAQGAFDAELVGEHRVKGREQPVALYRVVDSSRPDSFKL